jgi:hypothetical protein
MSLLRVLAVAFKILSKYAKAAILRPVLFLEFSESKLPWKGIEINRNNYA